MFSGSFPTTSRSVKQQGIAGGVAVFRDRVALKYAWLVRRTLAMSVLIAASAKGNVLRPLNNPRQVFAHRIPARPGVSIISMTNEKLETASYATTKA